MTKTLWTKDFIRITLATSLGAAGGIISGFALSFLVFDETGSTLASALVVAIQLLPGAGLPLLVAPLMDRYPRKPFLVGGDTVNALLYALAGVYLLRRDALNNMPEKFSLESDYFEHVVGDGALYAAECSGGFIDIGVPGDYELAQTMLAPLAKSWKLAMFDRDGTINVDTGHLHEPEKLELIPSTVDIMRGYSDDPDFKVVVVTNQAGIAKGLYTESDMRRLHRYMEDELERLGVHVDAWYFCPHHPDYTGPCECRKPAPGMLQAAMRDFDANSAGCVMFGDKTSDEVAAKAACVAFEWAGEALSFDKHI